MLSAANRCAGTRAPAPSGARRTRTRLRVTAVCAAAAMLLAACGPDPGVRVSEDVEVPLGAAIQHDPSAGSAEEPFDPEELRWAILDADLSGLRSRSGSVEEVLLYCAECLELADPVVIDGQKFQLATVRSPQVDLAFAGFAITEVQGDPVVQLQVDGTGLSLHPGSGRTVVVEEDVYEEDDAVCCPSGWSVRVYRYQNGRFEPGQRITRMDQQ